MMIFKRNFVKLAAVIGVSVVTGLGAGYAMASQPQMQNALSALEAAQDSLQQVHMDKGGHAAAERRLVAKAIEQVQDGINYGAAHGY